MPATLRPFAGDVGVLVTGVADGDMGSTSPGGPERRRGALDLPWVTARQVHGADVLTVTGARSGDGVDADGLVCDAPGLVLAVLTADCAPVVLSSPDGVIGVAHAGWRGLLAGVVEATVAAMRALGAGTVEAWLGPCIQPACYRFGEADLAPLSAALGPSVRGTDRHGDPALDVPAAVGQAVRAAGATLVGTDGRCTACDAGLWSWRAAGDRARQATAVWIPEPR